MALDFYPSEVVTPPLALVALLGCPSLHGRVGEYLRAAQKPPINSLGVAAPLRCARCACPPRTCALARAMRRKHLPSDTRAHTDARQSAAGERKSSSGASMAGILKVRAPAAASALTFLSGLPACPC